MTQLGWPLNTTLYIPEHNILYCPIAKNACTSLKGLMLEIAGYNVGNRSVHNLLDSGEIKLQLRFYNTAQQNQILDNKNAFKFAAIREPIERVISAYVEKFVKNRRGEEQWVHTKPVLAYTQGVSIENADAEKGITFRDFVKYILKHEDQNLDPHWRPQTSYLQGTRYTHLYSIRNLSKLRDDLMKHIGQEREIPHKNKATSTEFLVTAYSHPLYIDKYPAEIASKKLTKHNFWDHELIKELERRYALDYAVYDNL